MFFEKSKKIADDFLQSVVFLDDKAFMSTKTSTEDAYYNFDTQQISQVFAKENKICAVYHPTTKQDIDNFKIIALKADVVVLDWQILITEAITPETAEEDALADEPRGQYTNEIIVDIITKTENNALKLIIVYTGEDILPEISRNIYEHIPNKTDFQLKEEDCEVVSENIRILVRAKSNNADTDNRFTNRPNLLKKKNCNL